MICKYFLPLCVLSLHFLDNVFNAQEFLILMKSTLSYFFLLLYTYMQESIDKFNVMHICPVFPSKSFMVLALNFILVHGNPCGNPCFHVDCWKSSFPSPMWWTDYSFPADWTWHPCKQSIGCRCMGLFLDSKLYAMSLHVCWCASTTLLWFL